MSDTSSGIEMAGLMASEFHELKNQLGELTLMLDELGIEHPELASMLSRPRLLCQHIADRLAQVLTLYKDDRDRLVPNLEAISPGDFLDQLQAQAVSLAGARLEIVCRLGDAPPFWFFDRHLVELALLNAVHNALRHARLRIEIGIQADAGGLCFTVRDDSHGYPPHILEHQGRVPVHNAGGTGLGLYFAQVIADAHENKGRHGKLTLTNDPGATFSLWLP